MHLHTFLTEAHLIIKPRVYLEIGVQHGTSLRLAERAEMAFGVDPAPLRGEVGNERIWSMTSDDFFANVTDIPMVDFGFIDGLHLAEQALADYLNMEPYLHDKSVVIFDDVLPRNEGEAAREQCPGDWTGDVWKVSQFLKIRRPDLSVIEVDTNPTGTLMVWKHSDVTYRESMSVTTGIRDMKNLGLLDEGIMVSLATLDRTWALTPQQALNELIEFVNG